MHHSSIRTVHLDFIDFGLADDAVHDADVACRHVQVTMSAPINKEGLGTTKTSLIWEKFIAL